MKAAAPPSPPLPADVDLRDFGFLPLDVVRLRDSDLAEHASGEEFKAAVLLWCAAWHQVPAGSLPSDDKLLRKFAGFPRRWGAVKQQALRGFVLCDDGRLYHTVLCEKAFESWNKKRKQRARTAAATAAAAAARHRDEEQAAQRDGVRNGHRDGILGIGKGEGQGREKSEQRARAPALQSTGQDAETAPAAEAPAGAPKTAGETKIELEFAERARLVAEIMAAYPANPHSTAHDWTVERNIGLIVDNELATFEALLERTKAFAAQQDALGNTGQQFVPAMKNFFSYPRGPWQKTSFPIPEELQKADAKKITWKPGDPLP